MEKSFVCCVVNDGLGKKEEKKKCNLAGGSRNEQGWSQSSSKKAPRLDIPGEKYFSVSDKEEGQRNNQTKNALARSLLLSDHDNPLCHFYMRDSALCLFLSFLSLVRYLGSCCLHSNRLWGWIFGVAQRDQSATKK